MPCIKIPGGFMTVAGPDHHIKIDGEIFTFEDHHYCGPIPLGKRGDPIHLPDHHAFWGCVSDWYQQGKVIDKNGLCVWRHLI